MNIIEKISFNSISSKIVASIAVVSFTITLIIFSISKQITQETFYNIEFEKVNLIAQTIEPLIALNIYLGTYNNIAQLLEQVMENKYILSVEILDENAIIINKVSSSLNTQNNQSFIVEKNIYQPNSKKQIGTLVIVYSNKGYVEIVNKYINLTFLLLLTLVILFMLFGFYVKKLLSPLRKIARVLRHYSPDKEIKIPFSSQNNEIGLISNALNDMQEKISGYSKKQKNINHYLEEKINEKTIELRKQLYTDSLTGLANRFSLFNDIAEIEITGDGGHCLLLI